MINLIHLYNGVRENGGSSDDVMVGVRFAVVTMVSKSFFSDSKCILKCYEIIVKHKEHMSNFLKTFYCVLHVGISTLLNGRT